MKYGCIKYWNFFCFISATKSLTRVYTNTLIPAMDPPLVDLATDIWWSHFPIETKKISIHVHLLFSSKVLCSLV